MTVDHKHLVINIAYDEDGDVIYKAIVFEDQEDTVLSVISWFDTQVIPNTVNLEEVKKTVEL